MLLLFPSAGSARSPEPGCVPPTFEEARFTVCAFDSRRDELQLVVQDSSGKAYRRLSNLAKAKGGDVSHIRFAMNAGMFDGKGAPIGLNIENGKTVKALNTRDGLGNFHLKPNGVFLSGADDGVHVSTTADFQTQKPAARCATQSGPMLVISGALHPAFDADGASRYIRNGVGVINSVRPSSSSAMTRYRSASSLFFSAMS